MSECQEVHDIPCSDCRKLTSPMAQHVGATSHTMNFESTNERIIGKAKEIEKRPNNLNKRDGTQRRQTT